MPRPIHQQLFTKLSFTYGLATFLVREIGLPNGVVRSWASAPMLQRQRLTAPVDCEASRVPERLVVVEQRLLFVADRLLVVRALWMAAERSFRLRDARQSFRHAFSF